MKLSLSAGLAAGLLALAPHRRSRRPSPSTCGSKARHARSSRRRSRPTRAPFVANDGPHACGTTPTRGAAIAAAAQAPFAMRRLGRGVRQPDFETIDGRERRLRRRHRALPRPSTRTAGRAEVGACDDPVTSGDQVLFAYAALRRPVLLALSGPATAKPGETRHGQGDRRGDGRAGRGRERRGRARARRRRQATVGPRTTAAIRLQGQQGRRSAPTRVRVCVTDGADGACGDERRPRAGAAPGRRSRRRPTTPPDGQAAGLKDHQVFTSGPRELRGSFADTSGVQGRQAAADQARRQALLVLLRQARSASAARSAAAGVLRDRRPAPTGPTCCRRSSGRAATCSTPWRSTAPATAPRCSAAARGWCSPSDEAPRRPPSSRAARSPAAASAPARSPAGRSP